MGDDTPESPIKKPRKGAFVKGDPRAGRPPGCKNKATIEAREVARGLVSDPAYLAGLKARLLDGSLAPPVEIMLWHYAFYKPSDLEDENGKDGGELHIHVHGAMPVPPELVGENTTTTADSLMTYPQSKGPK